MSAVLHHMQHIIGLLKMSLSMQLTALVMRKTIPKPKHKPGPICYRNLHAEKPHNEKEHTPDVSEACFGWTQDLNPSQHLLLHC